MTLLNPINIITKKLTKKFNSKCKACREMKRNDLTFEETHLGEYKLNEKYHLKK